MNTQTSFHAETRFDGAHRRQRRGEEVVHEWTQHFTNKCGGIALAFSSFVFIRDNSWIIFFFSLCVKYCLLSGRTAQ